MKLKNLFFVPIVGLLLCSCGSKEEATGIAPAIFTSVAQTLTAQYTPVPPTEAFITETPTTTTIATTPTPYLTPTKYSASATQSKCDNSVYLSDVTIPDGTTVTAGATFTKTWKIKNTGTCAWSTSYSLKFLSGSQMSGAAVNLSESVASGKSTDISVTLTAPSSAGTYIGYWQLVNDSGTRFGSTVSVNIVVGSTPTGTITTTPTITLTPTSTSIPTQTPVYITVVVTAVPTATDTPVPPTDPPVPPTATEVSATAG